MTKPIDATRSIGVVAFQLNPSSSAFAGTPCAGGLGRCRVIDCVRRSNEFSATWDDRSAVFLGIGGHDEIPRSKFN